MIGKDFIFIDIPKTGTTSIYNYLENHNKYDTGPRHTHVPLQSYIDIYGDEAVKSRYVFTVLRNPFDRMVSVWKYYTKLVTHYREIDPDTPTTKECPHRAAVLRYLEHADNFDKFVNDVCNYNPPENLRQLAAYNRNFPYMDMCLKSMFNMLKPGAFGQEGYVDYFIKYKDYDAGWAHVCEQMNWEHEELPKSNVSLDQKPWREWYTTEQLERLKTSSLLKPDIQLYRYRTGTSKLI